MRIPIPHWLSSAWDLFGDYVNVPVYRKVRRIDIILLVFGIICVSYYWYISDWKGGILGGAVFILFVVMSIMFY